MEKGDNYLVMLEGGTAEIEEKKSRFIASFKAVNSEEEAVAFIDSKKKQYWDARHNVSAFVIGSRAELTRCSDDGEPAGTAGKPTLEVLLGSGVRNAAVVVTRYFGGTLLGTGGLVRAYSQATKEALEQSKIGMNQKGRELHLRMDYNDVGKVLYILGQRGLEAIKNAYEADVQLWVLLPIEEAEGFSKELIEATAGRIAIDTVDDYYFIKEL